MELRATLQLHLLTLLRGMLQNLPDNVISTCPYHFPDETMLYCLIEIMAWMEW